VREDHDSLIKDDLQDDTRTVCPIPHLGYCVYERCNFWDEEKQECSGLCLGDYTPLESALQGHPEGSCTIYWTEDDD